HRRRPAPAAGPPRRAQLPHAVPARRRLLRQRPRRAPGRVPATVADDETVTAGAARDRGRSRRLRALAVATGGPPGYQSMSGKGALVVVSTPIGNLGDLSPRAVEALASADAIACEATRRTRKLLSHAGVPAPTLLTVNDHSEARQVRAVLSRLDGG